MITERPMVKASVRRSMRMPLNMGLIFAPKTSIRPTPQVARNSPSAPPQIASSKLSVNNCLTSRPLPAPMAARIVISLCLAVDRASKQIGHVGAGDKQDKNHRSKDH